MRIVAATVALLTLLAACGEENRFIAPPPPKVTVQLPLQQTVTPYLEATGNTAAVNSVKLVARVQGYLQDIKYQDGAAVKKGAPLFVIEPEPYKVKVELEQAATLAEVINKVAVEVGLQTDTGYPHKGLLDYVAPSVNQSTGTLQVRGA